MEVPKGLWKAVVLTVCISFLLVMTLFLVTRNISSAKSSHLKQCKQPQSKHNAMRLSNVSLSNLLLTGVEKMTNEFLQQSNTSIDSTAAIFIFGSSGDTTTQTLVGNMHRQHSNASSSQSFVDANEKVIESETISSNAIIPEHVVHTESGIAFWNCPRLGNYPDHEIEIAAMYFLRYAMNMTKSAKILFAVSRSSVSSKDNQHDFDSLVTYAINMLKNISEMTGSIGLVVTDVHKFDPISGNQKSNEVILFEIVGFLKEYVNTKRIEMQGLHGQASQNELQRKINFVTGLLGESNSDFVSPRVYIFEREGHCGTLGKDLYTTELKYSQVSLDNFQFSLREETLAQVKTKFIPQVVDQIVNQISQTIINLQEEFRRIFFATAENNTEQGMTLIADTIYILSEKRFSHLESTPQRASLQMKTLLDMLPFKINYTNGVQMEIFENQLEFLNMSINFSVQTSKIQDTWLNSIGSMKTSLQELEQFFEFAHSTNQQVSGYNITNNPFNAECKPLPACKEAMSIQRNIPLGDILSNGLQAMSHQFRKQMTTSSVLTSAIFILGNKGSGKTTVTEILAGNQNYLHATKLPAGNFVIVDDNCRIANPFNSSKTVIPEFVAHANSHVAFWDCPAFDDTRAPNSYVAAKCFLKYSLGLTKFAKFLFTVRHSSLIGGQDNLDFDTMVTHAVRMLKNVTKLRHSIGLVVTKVGAFDPTSGHWISDEEILFQIMEFLRIYASKIENELYGISDGARKNELQSKLEFVRGILGESETNFENHRIFFIRRPSVCGPLQVVSLPFDSGRKQTNLLDNQLQYSPVILEDFSFPLKEEVLVKVKTTFIPEIADQISKFILQTFADLKREFERAFYKHPINNPEKRMSLLNTTTERLVAVNATQTAFTKSPISSSMKMLQETLPFRMDCTNHFEMYNFENTLQFLKIVFNETIYSPTPITLWTSSFDTTMRYLDGLRSFYEFGQSLEKHLAQYSKQVTLATLVKQNKHHYQDDTVLNFLQKYDLVEVPQRVHTFWSHSRNADKKYLANLVHEYIPRAKFTCNKSSTNFSMNQVVISGRILKLSDATNQNYWPKGCTKDNVNEILILGMKKIYLDKDYYTQKVLHLAIIAPEWELVLAEDEHFRSIQFRGVTPLPRFTANRGSSWGAKGQDGQHGISGADAGSFYGIYEYFEKETTLFVTTVGGYGQRGQDGGDGRDGEPGKDAKYNDFPPAYFSSRPDNLMAGKCSSDYGAMISRMDWYTMLGSNGKQGGDGGNGGNGGAPGRGGYIEIISLKHVGNLSTVSNVHSTFYPGKFGLPGWGGFGGSGGKNGNLLSCKRVFPFTHWILNGCYSCVSKISAGDGKRGLQGTFSSPDIISNQPKFQMWRLVNAYKNEFVGVESQFTSKLNSENQLTKLMTSLAFAKELEFYEKKYFEAIFQRFPGKRLYLLSNYENFRKRLDAYSAYLNGSETGMEESAALDVIYSAVLGKIAALRSSGYTSKVIKTNQYFDTLGIWLQNVKESRRETVIQQETESFKQALNTKIEQANKFVRDTVYPAIEMATTKVDELNNRLNLELAKFQKQGESDVINATKAKEMYKKVMPLKIGLDVLKFTGTICSFFGPKGVIVGQILSTSATLGKSLIPEIKVPQGHKLPQHFNQSLIKNHAECSSTKTRNIDKESELWEKVVADIDNDTLAELKEYADKRRESVEIYKQAVQNCSGNENPLNIAKRKQDVEKASSGLKAALARMVKKIEDRLPSDENQKEGDHAANKTTTKKEKNLKNCLKALNVLDAATDLGMSIWNASRDINNFTNAIQEAEKNVKVVKAKRAQFVYEFLPKIESIENDLKKESSQLSGKSQAALFVKQWEIKGMLKKMRQHVRGFTAGMEITEEFQLAIDTLDEAFTILVDLYEHMERYEEKKQFADFIAKVNSANGVLSQITDDELRGVLSRLNFHIRSNLFLEEYQSALHAFKQWVFPFASHYLHDCQNKTESIISGNTDQIVEFYMNEFEFLRMELAKYKSTTVDGDKYLIRNAFTSRWVSSEPFFVWKNQQWQTSIRRLLRGEPVQLLADVDMRGHTLEVTKFFWKKSAIKYKTVELSLKVKDERRQDKLNTTLNHFHLNMTHSGVSLYKVMGHQYVMFDSSQSYRYSFERIKDNMHVSVGTVKHKVDGPEVDFLMSPYTWWTFQLIDVKPGGIGFKDLTEFYDEVDLHLEGEGVYFDEERAPDTVLDVLNLDQYYETFDPEGYDVDGSYSLKCQNL